MHTNEYKFWQETVKFWHEKAEFYLSLDMVSDMERCIKKAENAHLMQYMGQENQIGLSINEFVVTGRKGFGVKPTLQVQVGNTQGA